jgi:hypothetical protein
MPSIPVDLQIVLDALQIMLRFVGAMQAEMDQIV